MGGRRDKGGVGTLQDGGIVAEAENGEDHYGASCDFSVVSVSVFKKRVGVADGERRVSFHLSFFATSYYRGVFRWFCLKVSDALRILLDHSVVYWDSTLVACGGRMVTKTDN